MSQEPRDIGIIGAGIETVRIHGFVVETGPEFIHGHLRETIRLLDEYGISYDPVHGKMYHLKGTSLKPSEDMVDGWDQLIESMKSIQVDKPFGSFLDEEFPGKKNAELRQSAIGFAEGFDLADTRYASTKGLYSEWVNEEAEQYRIPKGYGTLIRELENEIIGRGGKILLNDAVSLVDWYSKITVLTAAGHQFTCDRAIVTIPISLMNSDAGRPPLEFIPAIPEKQSAFNSMGYGTVIKIVTIWRSAFWKPIIPDAQFIFSDCTIPTWWTQFPVDLPVLTGWLGGPRAETYANQPDEFFLDHTLNTLSTIFSIPESELKTGLLEFKVFNWKNDPWSRGAYSYSRIGYKEAKTIAQEPAGNRLYFSGEGLYDGPYPGTVEAAVVHSLQTVKRLINDLGSDDVKN